MEFPTEFPVVSWAYVCLSEIRGKVPVCLRYVDLESNEILMESAPIELSTEDMLASTDFVLPIPPIPMPHEGMFAFELYAFDDLLGSLRIRAEAASEDEDEEQQEEEEEPI
jgi:hypothetical protein